MSLPPFKPLRKDVEGRLNAIRNMKTRPDDILLAIYPKSGRSYAYYHVYINDWRLFSALYRVLQKIKISKICSKGIFDVMHILLGRFRKIGIRFHRNTLGMGNCLDASKWQTWICKRRQGISLHGSCGRHECHRFTEVSKGAEHKLTIPLVAKETLGKWWQNYSCHSKPQRCMCVAVLPLQR